VVNAGGVTAIVGLEQLGWSQAELDEALARIGSTLTEIFEKAEAQGISTGAAAEALAEERLNA
jgi:leucine dehydrogenase